MSKNISVLEEMVMKGRDYTWEYDFEMFGDEISVRLGMIPDEVYIPISARLSEALDVDEEDVIEEAKEQVEDAKQEDGSIDVSQMNEGVVASLQTAAINGLVGAYDDDGEFVEIDEDKAKDLVTSMVGGYSIEIGGEILAEVSEAREDADKFR